MKKYFLSFVVVTILGLNACKKDNTDAPDAEPKPEEKVMLLPKKQMRAVWLATVYGLDWPQTDYIAASQQQQYIAYLEKFRELNINSVFVQIKGMGDAFYKSPYEPWSAYITGTRGKDPGYDVLKFMIDEAHARNIEFHAWINPFRIATRTSSATPYPPLHSSVASNWVVSHEKWQLYNPAIPEARQRLADIVKDIITKYEVDGIHMDDYFYPDPASAGQLVSDQEDYQTYKSGNETIEQFRRSNVDKAIKAVHDIIVANKPQIVFSISPTSDFAYNLNTLYADIKKWASEGWMDVVIPQIYSNASFATRLNTWDIFNNKPYLMIGHGYYQMNNASELTSQLSITKGKRAVVGTALYSAKYIYDKPDLTSKLKELFTDPAVIPFLGREVAPAPSQPQNLRIEGNTLKWSAVNNTRSVVYYTTDLLKEARVLTITAANQLEAGGSGYYAVTALNADNKESSHTKPVKK